MAVTRADIKNALLKHLYDRVRRGTSDKDASAATIRRAIVNRADFSTNYIEILLESLLEQGHVRDVRQSKRFSITEAGIELVESGWLYSEGANQIVDSWSKPDNSIVLTASASDQIRVHLSQCLLLLSSSNLTQEERAQVAGLIKICEQILELPTPKLGLLKRILGWLKEVNELLPIIDAALKLLGKA